MMALQRNLRIISKDAVIKCMRGTSRPVQTRAVKSPPSLVFHRHQYFSTQANPSESQPQRKRLDIALVGLPNAGKSQLLNSLVGIKVAAVSRKRHTTRSGILAARNIDDTQLVFVDTPGFMHHEKTSKEGVRQLAAEASSEMDEVDFTLLVVDGARRLDEDTKRTIVMLMFMALRSRGRREGNSRVFDEKNLQAKFAVVLNKVDLVSPKERLLEGTGELGSMSDCCIRLLLQQRRSPSKVRLGDLVNHVLEKHADEQGFDNVHDDDLDLFATLIPNFLFTSAIDKDDEGVDDILRLLLERATHTSEDWIVDTDEDGSASTLMSPVQMVEEILREKIYRCLHREVPHNVAQQNKMFRYAKLESDDGGEKKVLHIGQDLVVRTKSHQKLVLGTGGKTLQRIKTTALKDLEELFDCQVDLELNVKLNKSMREVPLEAETSGALSRMLD